MSLFSKKHYIAFTKFIKNNNFDNEQVQSFCELFEADNPNFDRSIFIENLKQGEKNDRPRRKISSSS